MRDRQIITRLAALAHLTRLRTFRLLVRAGPEGLASGVIAQRLKVPPTTMSTHLAVLARSGLVEARRESRLVYYSLAPEAVRALWAVLMDECCAGQPELCAPSTARRPEGPAKRDPRARPANGQR